jgi:hypothetical protein
LQFTFLHARKGLFPTRHLKCCWSDLMWKSDQKIWYQFDSKKSTFSDDISKSDQKNSRSNWYQIFLICICLEKLISYQIEFKISYQIDFKISYQKYQNVYREIYKKNKIPNFAGWPKWHGCVAFVKKVETKCVFEYGF